MEEETKSSNSKTVAPSLILGFFIALIAMALPMIGVTVNLYLGASILLVAFGLLAFGFWKWEKTAKWRTTWRVNTLWVLGLIYFSLVGFQIFSQYKKDHPQPKASEIVSETPQKQNSLPQQYPQTQESQLKSDDKSAKIPKAIQSSQRQQSLSTKAQQTQSTPLSIPVPQQIVNAPNGIGTIGGMLINPQVNNFGKITPSNRTIRMENARIAIADLQRAAGSKVQFCIIGGTEEINTFSNNVAGLFVEGKWKLVSGGRIAQLTLGDGQGHVSHGEGIECGGIAGNAAFEAEKSAMRDAGYPCREVLYTDRPFAGKLCGPVGKGHPSQTTPENIPDVYIQIGTRILPED